VHVREAARHVVEIVILGRPAGRESARRPRPSARRFWHHSTFDQPKKFVTVNGQPLRPTVLQGRWEALGEQVVRNRYMGIGIDDGRSAHRVTPETFRRK